MLRLIHKYLAAKSEAKVVYKEPLFVIDCFHQKSNGKG